MSEKITTTHNEAEDVWLADSRRGEVNAEAENDASLMSWASFISFLFVFEVLNFLAIDQFQIPRASIIPFLKLLTSIEIPLSLGLAVLAGHEVQKERSL